MAIGTGGRFKLEVDGVGATTWVSQFDGEEGISQLFQFHVVLTSDDRDIACADVIGKTAVLTLETDDLPPRFVHGMVSRFELGEDNKRYAVYHLTLVPKAWRCLYRHDARIFQAMAVPDILEAVLGGAGIGDYRLSLEGTHSPREYCVQYRESDWAFLSRLMEEEGIYYFFEHEHGKHTLVIGDGPNAPAPIASPDTIAFRAPLGAMAHGESVSRFNYAEEVRPGKVTLTDFNFKKPNLSLLETSSAQDDVDLEIYDYPGEYEVPGEGTTLAKLRVEEWQSVRKVADGEGGVMRFFPGSTFSLSEHGRDALNGKYLLTRLHHHGVQSNMGSSGAGGEQQSYLNRFQCIPSDVPYRPARRTPRPTIKGVQTAIVVGPAGEEIYTDEHGRVKVQFHWDRLGKKNEKSSCWIRVSQLWAGAGWGAMWIPRIGHEVVVDFVEGDPDRPLIVGRVYHGANVPPYPLPADKTKSTIKSNSSSGGGGNNELRFEDRKGSEEIWLHGQKDWNIVIEHDKTQDIGRDETLHVGHDRKKTVDNNQSETIGANKSIKVGQSHTEAIGGKETVAVGGNAAKVVGGSYTLGVAGDSNVEVGGAHTESVGKKMLLSVGEDKEENVGKVSTEIVGADKKVTISGEYKVSVSKNMASDVEGDLTEEVKGEMKLTVGKDIKIECGDVKISIEKSGKLTVEAKDVTLKCDGPVKVESQKLKIKSDGTVDVEASGAVKVKGSGVNIN